jgi:hypothetical protein
LYDDGAGLGLTSHLYDVPGLQTLLKGKGLTIELNDGIPTAQRGQRMKRLAECGNTLELLPS